MTWNLYLSVQEEPAKKMPKFNPFTGLARRLDGKPSTQPTSPATYPVLKQHRPEAEKDINGSKSSSSASRLQSGKLVFGSNVNQPQNEARKVCLIMLMVLWMHFIHLCQTELKMVHFFYCCNAINWFALVFLLLGYSKEKQSRAISEGGRTKVSSIHWEEVFTKRLTLV